MSKANLTLINETGYCIYNVYFSVHDEDEWSDDIMEQDVLEDNDYVNIEYDLDDGDNTYDIKMVDEENDESFVFEMGLTGDDVLRVYYDEDDEFCFDMYTVSE